MLCAMRYCALFFSMFLVQPANADLFSAAGRIEHVSGESSCSAALIEADVIVTAAHCVRESSEQGYNFRLGLGQKETPLAVRRIIIHPLFQDFRGHRLRRLRFDIAIGQLETPIDPQVAAPFLLGDEAELGEGLFLASWRGDQGPRPRQRRCLVIESELSGVVTLGCRVRGGESGAPVLRLTDDGLELVAIVNSTARQGRQSVAFASDVRLRIPPLLDRLKSAP